LRQELAVPGCGARSGQGCALETMEKVFRKAIDPRFVEFPIGDPQKSSAQ
jgi:hypothetical protein